MQSRSRVLFHFLTFLPAYSVILITRKTTLLLLHLEASERFISRRDLSCTISPSDRAPGLDVALRHIRIIYTSCYQLVPLHTCLRTSEILFDIHPRLSLSFAHPPPALRPVVTVLPTLLPSHIFRDEQTNPPRHRAVATPSSNLHQHQSALRPCLPRISSLLLQATRLRPQAPGKPSSRHAILPTDSHTSRSKTYRR